MMALESLALLVTLLCSEMGLGQDQTALEDLPYMYLTCSDLRLLNISHW